MRQKRSDYKELTIEEQNEYFNDITNDFYQLCLNNKDKLINVVKDFHYIRKHMYGLNGTIGNGLSSYLLDLFVSKVIKGKYVDLKGYDIAVEDYGKTIRVSSKAAKELFLKSSGTHEIIDSNKLAQSETYDDTAHKGNTDSDVYILIQTNEQIIIAVAPKKASTLMEVNSGSNTMFTIPNDSYVKYVVSKEDKVFLDENYVPENQDIHNAINAWNTMIDNYAGENNEAEKSI